MIRLFSCVVGAVVIGAGCAGSGDHPNLDNHYFLVGKRACKRLVKKTPGSVTVYAIDLNSYPAKYRADVAKGCNTDR